MGYNQKSSFGLPYLLEFASVTDQSFTVAELTAWDFIWDRGGDILWMLVVRLLGQRCYSSVGWAVLPNVLVSGSEVGKTLTFCTKGS